MKNGKLSLSGYITRMAILVALVIVLQTLGSYIKIMSVSISLVLIPIVFGGMTLGVLSGTILGFVFGLITLIAGITGTDYFTNVLFAAHPFGTSLICLVKGAAAGFIPAVVFKALKNKNQTLASIVSAALAPIANTGLFITGVLLFVQDTVSENFLKGESIMYFLIIGCAGINFIVEFLLNVLTAPALCRVYRAIAGKKNEDNSGKYSISEKTEETIPENFDKNEEKSDFDGNKERKKVENSDK